MNTAFVGNGFNLKYTKSNQFFIEVLRAWRPNLKVFSEEWVWATLPRSKPWDLVVFFQQIPTRAILDAVEIHSVILVPMYDDCSHEREFWEPYRDCSFVCFSQALADLLEAWGHRVIRLQYYPPVPEQRADWEDGLKRAFFWPRKPNLGWPVVRTLLGNSALQEVHLHVTENADILTAGLTTADAERWAMTRTSWFVNRQGMLAALGQCQLYFAPRRSEGIGMAFLEAMALGLAVVAPDASTMNEYIETGVNGYLYDPDNPLVPDWSAAQAWGLRARASAVRGRSEWVEAIPNLLTYLSAPGPTRAQPHWSVDAGQLHRTALSRYRRYLMLEPLRWLKRWGLSLFQEKR